MEFLSQADHLEKVFWFLAIAGTLFFLLRVVMMMVGADGVDGSDGLDAVDTGDAGLHHAHTDAAFQIVSINTLTAFFMMFGWGGLTAYKQFGLSAAVSVLTAFLVGASCMVITAYLFKAVLGLSSRGSVFDISETVGKTATVYQRILAEERGRINIVSASGQLRELDAVSEDHVEIDAFQSVQVVRVVNATTVAVRKVQ